MILKFPRQQVLLRLSSNHNLLGLKLAPLLYGFFYSFIFSYSFHVLSSLDSFGLQYLGSLWIPVPKNVLFFTYFVHCHVLFYLILQKSVAQIIVLHFQLELCILYVDTHCFIFLILVVVEFIFSFRPVSASNNLLRLLHFFKRIDILMGLSLRTLNYLSIIYCMCLHNNAIAIDEETFLWSLRFNFTHINPK